MGGDRVETGARSWTLLCALVLTGCAAAPPPAEPPPSSTPVDPVVVCTNQIDHWASIDLAPGPSGDPGFDYQHRALSARVDTALREIVAQARAEGGAPPEVIHERARAACEAMIAQDPSPSGY